MRLKNYFSAFLLAGLMISATTMDAQTPETDPKFEVRYGAVDAVETEEFDISFSEMHCQMEFALVKITIMNHTDDWLYFDPSKVTFTASGSDYVAKGRVWRVDPNKSKSKTVKVAGEGNYKSDTYAVKIDGAVQLLPSTGIVSDPGPFKIPAASNSVKTDSYKVSLVDIKKKTKETLVVFECTYIGKDIGLVFNNEPSMCPEGMEDKMYSTDNMKDKVKVLKPGKKTKVKMLYHIPAKVVDMQFADLLIHWNGTLVETKFEDIDFSHTLDLKRDEALTKAKNQ
ncbi:MAG: hypothetical protein ACI84C_000873 [Flavobacteriales bacterium]|jgi:hypothetical protein